MTEDNRGPLEKLAADALESWRVENERLRDLYEAAHALAVVIGETDRSRVTKPVFDAWSKLEDVLERLRTTHPTPEDSENAERKKGA